MTNLYPNINSNLNLQVSKNCGLIVLRQMILSQIDHHSVNLINDSVCVYTPEQKAIQEKCSQVQDFLSLPAEFGDMAMK